MEKKMDDQIRNEKDRKSKEEGDCRDDENYKIDEKSPAEMHENDWQLGDCENCGWRGNLIETGKGRRAQSYCCNNRRVKLPLPSFGNS